MAVIKTNGGYNALPISYKRGNPIPLDKSSVWYDYDSMAAYAASDPTAYVGQILSLVEESNNLSKIYIILNTAGDLKEIGSGSLEQTTENIILRLESIEKSIEVFKEDIEELTNLVGSPVEGENPSSGIFAELDKKANSTDVYTKNETDLKIDSAVAAAAHLKRKEVQSIDEIDINASDAEQYIYMVPSGLTDDDNKYYEYMVIEIEIIDSEGIATKIKKVEQVGSWSVDLSVYAKAQDLIDERDRAKLAEKANADAILQLQEKDTELLNNKVDKVFYTVVNEDGSTSQVEGTLLTPDEKAKLAALSIEDNGNIGISGNVNVDNVQGLENWIANNGDDLLQNLSESNFSQSVINKLNFITSVDDTRFSVVNGNLKFVPIKTTDIEDFNGFDSRVDDLETHVENLLAAVGNEQTGLSAVNSKLSDLEKVLTENYVTINDFNAVVGNLDELLQSNTTIIAQINDINNRLTWQDLN